MGKSYIQDQVDPFDLGYEAHRLGKGPKANPFGCKDLEKAADWQNGWDC